MPEYRIEANIQPIVIQNNWEDPVVDILVPLVDGLRTKSLLECWHYLREDDHWRGAQQPLHPRIRGRFRARTANDLAMIKNLLNAALSQAQREGKISDFYYGAHGSPDQTYAGEAPDFDEAGPNPRGWAFTQKWMEVSSDLSLLLLQVRRGRINPARQLHFYREIHFFCNPLGKSEQIINDPSQGSLHVTTASD